MPAEITMPQLSDTMSEGTLVKWRKKEGDAVKEGEVIAEVETDKATMEMEAFESGTIALLAVKEGDKVKVGERLAVVATAGEKANEVKSKYSGGAAAPAAVAAASEEKVKKGPAEAPKPAAATAKSAPTHGQGAATRNEEMGSNIEEGRAQSRRESVKAEAAVSAESISRQAHDVISKTRGQDHGHARSPESNGGRMKVSPLARRIAADRGVDLKSLKGSGPGGRIIQRDVMEAADGSGSATSAETAAAPASQGARG